MTGSAICSPGVLKSSPKLGQPKDKARTFFKAHRLSVAIHFYAPPSPLAHVRIWGRGEEKIGDHVLLGLPQTALDTFSFGYQNSPTS